MEDLAENIDGNISSQSAKYVVFPCVYCGKYTYTKATQKARKCGICGKNMQIATLKNTYPASNVNTAAKLANQKNNAWLATKGIQITSDSNTLKKITVASKHMDPSPLKKTVAENPHAESLLKIKHIMETEEIVDLRQIPVTYLKILYDVHGVAPKNFDAFYRFFMLTQSHTKTQ